MAAVTVINPNVLNLPPYRLPQDYLTLPENYHPKPRRFVGLLACQMDPTLRSLDSIITRMEKKTAEMATTKGKPKKADKKAQAAASEAEEWEIEFEDTGPPSAYSTGSDIDTLFDSVIFPEGGGQPYDTGVLSLQTKKGTDWDSVKVDSAFRRKLDAVHLVRFPTGSDPAAHGWVVGAQVHMEVDWGRRKYHMQQHTGQHLLSAVFEHELKNETLGWQLSTSGQPSYVDMERAPSEEEIAYVVQRCNDIIQNGTRVRVNVRLESDHERPGTLPEDYRDGVIRYITIDNLDVNPCCGTHHPSLAFLGSLFIFPGVTAMSGPPRSRINFVVGDALTKSLATAHALVKDVGLQLECGPPDINERLGQLLKGKKDATRREKVLRAESCAAYAIQLAASLKEINGVHVGKIHREEESTDVEFLTSILHSFTPPSDGKWLAALASGPISASGTLGGCLLLTGSDDALVKKAGELVKVNFEGRIKGGGGKGKWQGKVIGSWHKGDDALVDQILSEAAGRHSCPTSL
ncbi:ThrRS/AlaRS common domain-containing protein [Sistotremastrum suecicum HHB10207 ss-3]|uniref:ThrRS/AlaRS common domain-containing protein n=1 Tax=Sistotremastrum suecicum HHB10207 ss-3 TaxID=1314776 RepID=A0A166BEG6_9AGAM|nr:ThrRS/AlaRS common domain-containing protein [Sistotremastrum suecicum HHB10207 ss-3]